MKTVVIILAIAFAAVTAGCASNYKMVDLSYEKSVNAKGGTGDLFIANPIEKHGASKLPSGVTVIGNVKNSDVLVATKDSISEWVMTSLMHEFYSAGYNVKTAPELPADVTKGIKVIITKISANQIPEEMVVKDETVIGIDVEVWKEGKLIKTLTFENKNEGKGLRRTAGLISVMLKRTLQDIVQQIVPNVMKTLAEDAKQ